MREMTFSDLLQTKFTIFSLSIFTLVNFGVAYQSSLLNVMLKEIYNLEPQISTLIYVAASFGFVFATPLAGIIL